MSDIQQCQIQLERPFDLDLTIDSWIYPEIQPVPEMKSSNQFSRCIPFRGLQIPIRVIQKQKGIKPELILEWQAPKDLAKNVIIQRVGWLLGWDIDTRPVLKAIQDDPIIAHLARPLEGLHPYSQPSVFEALVKAILQQQVSYRSANQITRKLVEEYGPRCKLANQYFYGFPTREGLSHLSEADLRACKVGYKAPYLVGLFKQLLARDLKLDELVKQKTPVILNTLNEIRGIGLWTAELTVLTGLRRLDVFPSGDLGIRAIISQLYLNGKPVKRKDVEQVSQRWGKVRAQVLYFLLGAQVLGLV